MWTATKAETFACKLKGVHPMNEQDWRRACAGRHPPPPPPPHRPSPDSPATSSLVSEAVRKPQRRRVHNHNISTSTNTNNNPQKDQVHFQPGQQDNSSTVHVHAPPLVDTSSEPTSPLGVRQYDGHESSSLALKVHYENKLFTPSRMDSETERPEPGPEAPAANASSCQGASSRQRDSRMDSRSLKQIAGSAANRMHAEHASRRGATQKWLNQVEVPKRLSMHERRHRTTDSAELSRTYLQRKLVLDAFAESSKAPTPDSSFMQQPLPRLAEKCTSRGHKGVITTFMSAPPTRSISCSHPRSHSATASTHTNLQSAFSGAEAVEAVSGQSASKSNAGTTPPMSSRSESDAVGDTTRVGAGAAPDHFFTGNSHAAVHTVQPTAAATAAAAADGSVSDCSRRSDARRSCPTVATSATHPQRPATARAISPSPQAAYRRVTAPPRSDPHPKLSPTRIPLPPCMRHHSMSASTLPTMPSLPAPDSSTHRKESQEVPAPCPSIDENDRTDTLNLDPHYPAKSTPAPSDPPACDIPSDAPRGAERGVLSVSSCADSIAPAVLRRTASDACTPHTSSLNLCSVPSTMQPGPASGRSTTPTVPTSPARKRHHNIVEADYDELATHQNSNRAYHTQRCGPPRGYVTPAALPSGEEEHSRTFETPLGGLPESSESTRACAAQHSAAARAQVPQEASAKDSSVEPPVATKPPGSAASEEQLAATHAAASRAAAAHSAKVAAMVPKLRLITPPKEPEIPESEPGEAMNAEVMASLQQRIRARHSKAHSARPFKRPSRLSAHFATTDRTASETLRKSHRSLGTRHTSVGSSGRRSMSTHSVALSHQDLLEDGVKVTSDSQTVRKAVQGFDVNSANACCSTSTWTQMTNDVDFGAVSQGTKHKWFLKGARKLFERNAPRPAASHGCSAALASVHRHAPPLACARRVVNKSGETHIRLRPTTSYESVGVWRDSDNRPCLVIQAHFADGGHKMMLLYEESRMHVNSSAPLKSFRDLPECSEGQWCTLTAHSVSAVSTSAATAE